jgi:hypothetical protein
VRQYEVLEKYHHWFIIFTFGPGKEDRAFTMDCKTCGPDFFRVYLSLNEFELEEDEVWNHVLEHTAREGAENG